MLRLASFAAAALLAVATPYVALGETLRFVTGNVPPYSIETGARPGFIREFVAEMGKILQVDIATSFHPVGEAIELARTGENTLVFPLARTPQREQSYTWVVKLFDMEARFVTAPGSAAIASLDEAKGKRVGALKGSAFTTWLASQGFSGVVEGAPAELAAKLAAGEIDTWFVDTTEGRGVWQAGGHKGDLVEGHRGFTGALWLGASPTSPAIDKAAWEDAFQVLQQDGTFDRIYQSYGLN